MLLAEHARSTPQRARVKCKWEPSWIDPCACSGSWTQCRTRAPPSLSSTTTLVRCSSAPLENGSPGHEPCAPATKPVTISATHGEFAFDRGQGRHLHPDCPRPACCLHPRDGW